MKKYERAGYLNTEDGLIVAVYACPDCGALHAVETIALHDTHHSRFDAMRRAVNHLMDGPAWVGDGDGA